MRVLVMKKVKKVASGIIRDKVRTLKLAAAVKAELLELIADF